MIVGKSIERAVTDHSTSLSSFHDFGGATVWELEP